jgi:hypothetical protein
MTQDNEYASDFNEDVGQDNESYTQEDSEKNWEDQAKYFQSEKDKLYAENQKLEKYAKIGKYLESNPDAADVLKKHAEGGGQPQQENISLDRDEFDPWEAYNDPKSKSYQARVQERDKVVSEAVNKAVGEVNTRINQSQLVDNLREKGLDEKDVESFMKFASKNPAEYGLDGAIRMWQAAENTESSSSPLDRVREQQQVPSQGGVLNGEQPVRKDEKDTMWDSIKKAGSRNNVL